MIFTTSHKSEVQALNDRADAIGLARETASLEEGERPKNIAL